MVQRLWYLGQEEMLGIVDLRLLGYYKIKQGILQQSLSKYYRFERAETFCESFNKLVNTLKKEKWTKDSRRYIIHGWTLVMKWKYMTDWDILNKYIDLENSCFDKGGKERSHGNTVQIQRCI